MSVRMLHIVCRGFLPALGILLFGCKTTEVTIPPQSFWDDPIWMENTVEELYFDYLDDQDFDYAWNPEVPTSIREELKQYALNTYSKKDG